MPVYTVKTIDEEGKVAVGEFNTPDRKSLEKTVARDGKVILQVRESEKKNAARASGKVRTTDLTDLLIYISITTSSGIPLTTALQDFIEQVRNARFKEILTEIFDDVNRGTSFSGAVARFRNYFGTIFVNAVAAGEETGSLDKVMDNLRSQLDWQSRIKATFRQALIYPAFLIVAVIGLVIILLTFLLPRIMGIYADAKIELPTPTKILIAVSDFLRYNWAPLLCVVVAFPLGIFILRRFERGRILFDRMILKLPVFGRILAEIALARFTVIFKTMLSSGVEILRSIEISGASSGNRFIQEMAMKMVEEVKNGYTLSAAVEKFREMSFLLPRMVAIGEKSGKIVEALDCAYRYFDQSIPKKVSRMISLIEPTIIIVAGVLVGFILLGALMPIYTMYSAM